VRVLRQRGAWSPLHYQGIYNTTFEVKDIVYCLTKKIGVKRGINRFALTLYTVANVFKAHLKGYSCALNFKKTGYSSKGLKKFESFLMWSALPKA
jgi:hypothetical protein